MAQLLDGTTPLEDFYTIAAAKLRKAIRANGLRPYPTGNAEWANQLRRLNVPQQRIKNAINWLGRHGRTPYTPKVTSARVLCAKFTDVEAAMQRAKNAPAIVEISDAARAISEPLGLYWTPTRPDAVNKRAELEFIQISLDNYTPWYTALMRLERTIEWENGYGAMLGMPGHTYQFAQFLNALAMAARSPSSHVSHWCHRMWRISGEWEITKGNPPLNLRRHVWQPRHAQYWRDMYELARGFAEDHNDTEALLTHTLETLCHANDQIPQHR